MKWIDKNGNQLEGTIEEYKEWLKLESKAEAREEHPETKVIVVKEAKRLGRSNGWSREEHKILKENYGTMRIDALMKLLPRRTKGSIKSQAYLTGLTKEIKKNCKTPHLRRYKKENKNIPRFKFMNQRANELMRNFNWSREQAFVQASREWNTKIYGLGTAHSDKIPTQIEQTQAPIENVSKTLYELWVVDLLTKHHSVVNTYSDVDEANKEKLRRENEALELSEKVMFYVIEREVSL